MEKGGGRWRQIAIHQNTTYERSLPSNPSAMLAFAKIIASLVYTVLLLWQVETKLIWLD
jgi:hypothetical protein